MTAFWLAGAALAAVALAVVLWPLARGRRGAVVSRRDANASIHRDQRRELDADLAAGTLAQADYDRARRELEARVLEDLAGAAEEPPAPPASRALLATLAVALPVAALGVYLITGNPGALLLENEREATERQIDAMVERLATRLRDQPEDVEGWKLLGRSYAALGRFKDSADAYAKAAARAPNDAALLTDYADVLAMTRGEQLEGEPEALVLRALKIEPDNLKALALAGTAAFQRKDFAGALRHWERMLPLVEPGSEDARSIQGSIAEARSLMGAAAPAAKRKAAAATVAALKGSVQLAPELKARAAPEDTVFIFARAAQGPPMPLAVRRVRVRDLPVEFALDDSMAMAPGMTLSAHQQVVVGARISKSGSATPQPGDLQGLSAVVANNAGGVRVVIDSIVGEKRREMRP